MKHLKRIFESTEELDTDYIEMCFVDFIDQGCEIEVDTDDDGRKYIELMPNLPGIEYSRADDGSLLGWTNKNKRKTLDDVIKSSKELYDFYDELNTCIKKVKIKYPNIEVEFNIEREGYDDNNPFDAYLHITFMLPKNIKRIPLEKGKLGTVNFSDLDDTWDIRGEN
jgi:hypothetical protein